MNVIIGSYTPTTSPHWWQRNLSLIASHLMLNSVVPVGQALNLHPSLSETLEVATLISMGGFEAGTSGWTSIERPSPDAFDRVADAWDTYRHFKDLSWD
jgi:hypothetical protein